MCNKLSRSAKLRSQSAELLDAKSSAITLQEDKVKSNYVTNYLVENQLFKLFAYSLVKKLSLYTGYLSLQNT